MTLNLDYMLYSHLATNVNNAKSLVKRCNTKLFFVLFFNYIENKNTSENIDGDNDDEDNNNDTLLRMMLYCISIIIKSGV